jgi:beta-glucosidase
MNSKKMLTILGIGLLSSLNINSQILYKDLKQPIEKRISDLISRMTIEEKVAQLMMSKNIIWDKAGNIKKEVAKNHLDKGIGLLWFDQYLEAERMVEIYNASQKFLMEESRLGIPAFVFGEGLHGVLAPKTTMFPQAIAMASTWDTELIEEVYSAIALEMRTRGANLAFTPVIGLARDPRWGRTDETFGEDPYLVGHMGVAAINGLQGRNAKIIDKNHVASTVKHFVGHSVPQSGVNRAPASLTKRSLYEHFFLPFEMAVKEAGVKSIMATYHEIDGTPIVGSKHLLTQTLRNDWGFDGLIISDADAIDHMHALHRITANKGESAKKAIEAGVDFDLAIFKKEYCFQELPAMVKAGKVSKEALNRAVSKVLKVKFELGLFDDPYMDVKRVNQVTRSQNHIDLALKTAEKAITLLKNKNHLLPLDISKIKKLAVIGPNASELQFGSYSMDEKHGVSILEGLKSYGKGKFEVTYAEGCRITNEIGMWKPERNGTLVNDPEKDKIAIQKAVKVVAESDVAIVVIGGNEFTARETWSDEHLGDRGDLNLLGSQNEMVQEILKTGKPVVVILINGRPLTINEIDEKAPAIIECWYLGEKTGTAVAKTLFGEVNPGGKLPITFPRSVGQLPYYYNHQPTAHLYAHIFDKKGPLYPFGYGLSYTTFAYSNLKITPQNALADQSIKVSVLVKNTGKITGDEVVQLYIRDDISSIIRPVKELKGFKRITLKEGEAKTVTFKIGREELQFYNEEMKRVVEPGKFIIMVGGNSQDLITSELIIKE